MYDFSTIIILLLYNYFLLFKIFLARLDNQISYNQELELKLKELNNASVFQKKLSDKEIESLRIKLKSSHDTLSQLGWLDFFFFFFFAFYFFR